jgi:N-acetylneuraminate synthase/sialic acid synthase
MNLRAITSFREQFPDVVIGLSSHDSGIAMVVGAYILGARIVEKHFTLNRVMKGTDHAFSLERGGMRRVVRDLKRVRVALGDGVKTTYQSEVAPLLKMGKKLVAAVDLPANHVLRREDIAIKSPSDGTPPFELDQVIGKVTRRPLKEDENIAIEDLDGSR